MKDFKVENCANSVDSCVEAQKGGAYRVELCAGIPEGGTTPSYGEIAMARELLQIKLHVIIRPRGGDFLYSPVEKQIMLKDIETARKLGVDGVVVGCLTPEGEIDMPFLREMVDAAGDCSVTFHRAFDMCREPYRAMEQIIEAGCDRILTSGQQPTAEMGIPLLKRLVKMADGRIIIMPGCGVNEKNIRKIAEETEAAEFHFSARETKPSGMVYRNPVVSMGGTVHIDEYELSLTSAARVKNTIKSLKG